MPDGHGGRPAALAEIVGARQFHCLRASSLSLSECTIGSGNSLLCVVVPKRDVNSAKVQSLVSIGRALTPWSRHHAKRCRPSVKLNFPLSRHAVDILTGSLFLAIHSPKRLYRYGMPLLGHCRTSEPRYANFSERHAASIFSTSTQTMGSSLRSISRHQVKSRITTDQPERFQLQSIAAVDAKNCT